MVTALAASAAPESIRALKWVDPDLLTRLIFVLRITRMRMAGTIRALNMSVSSMTNDSSTQSSEWRRSRAMPSRIQPWKAMIEA